MNKKEEKRKRKMYKELIEARLKPYTILDRRALVGNLTDFAITIAFWNYKAGWEDNGKRMVEAIDKMGKGDKK